MLWGKGRMHSGIEPATKSLWRASLVPGHSLVAVPRFCFLKSSQGIHRKKPKRKRCFGKSSWPQTAIGVASIGDPIHPTSQHHPLLEALGRGPFRRSLRRVMQAQNMQRKEENITSAFTKLGTHPEVSCMKSLKIAQCLGGLIEFGRRFNGRECYFFLSA